MMVKHTHKKLEWRNGYARCLDCDAIVVRIPNSTEYEYEIIDWYKRG